MHIIKNEYKKMKRSDLCRAFKISRQDKPQIPIDEKLLPDPELLKAIKEHDPIGAEQIMKLASELQQAHHLDETRELFKDDKLCSVLDIFKLRAKEVLEDTKSLTSYSFACTGDYIRFATSIYLDNRPAIKEALKDHKGIDTLTPSVLKIYDLRK